MAASKLRRITYEDVGAVTVVRFLDKKIVDELNIQTIGDDLMKLVDELGRKQLLLEFSAVEFLSSAALGKLSSLHDHLADSEGKLVLCSISKTIMEIFTLTRLDKLLTIVKDEKTALRSF